MSTPYGPKIVKSPEQVICFVATHVEFNHYNTAEIPSPKFTFQPTLLGCIEWIKWEIRVHWFFSTLGFLKCRCQSPTHSQPDLIGLGYDLSFRIWRKIPGGSNVQQDWEPLNTQKSGSKMEEKSQDRRACKEGHGGWSNSKSPSYLTKSPPKREEASVLQTLGSILLRM